MAACEVSWRRTGNSRHNLLAAIRMPANLECHFTDWLGGAGLDNHLVPRSQEICDLSSNGPSRFLNRPSRLAVDEDHRWSGYGVADEPDAPLGIKDVRPTERADAVGSAGRALHLL